MRSVVVLAAGQEAAAADVLFRVDQRPRPVPLNVAVHVFAVHVLTHQAAHPIVMRRGED